MAVRKIEIFEPVTLGPPPSAPTFGSLSMRQPAPMQSVVRRLSTVRLGHPARVHDAAYSGFYESFFL
jgi:hypothetical protein